GPPPGYRRPQRAMITPFEAGGRPGDDVATTQLSVNGLRLLVQDEGDGAPVLLLHGWPDSHRLWRHQVPALPAAGYRGIAPDLRGFGESDRPADIEAYALPHHLADVQAIADQLGIERFTVVGHDWGAAIAWAFASLVPDRIDKLAAISVGHPTAFRDADFEQRRRSWYML